MTIDPADIFHACVMPCSDKKLEASRADFTVPGTSIKEVDCVISTSTIAGKNFDQTSKQFISTSRKAFQTRFFSL
jgi:iron only hydrogenase large subunit-like protein